jgi:hypothetical protein
VTTLGITKIPVCGHKGIFWSFVHISMSAASITQQIPCLSYKWHHRHGIFLVLFTFSVKDLHVSVVWIIVFLFCFFNWRSIAKLSWHCPTLAQQAYALPKIVEKDGFNISLWSSMEQIHWGTLHIHFPNTINFQIQYSTGILIFLKHVELGQRPGPIII